MKLTKKQGGNFLPHEEGTFRAVCVDAVSYTHLTLPTNREV